MLIQQVIPLNVVGDLLVFVRIVSTEIFDESIIVSLINYNNWILYNSLEDAAPRNTSFN